MTNELIAINISKISTVRVDKLLARESPAEHRVGEHNHGRQLTITKPKDYTDEKFDFVVASFGVRDH